MNDYSPDSDLTPRRSLVAQQKFAPDSQIFDASESDLAARSGSLNVAPKPKSIIARIGWVAAVILTLIAGLYAFDWLPIGWNAEVENQTQLEGSLYSGKLVKGQFSGVGRLQFSDGIVYQGDFRAGVFSGTGTLTNQDNQILFQGEFADGKVVYGTFTDAKGNEYTGSVEGGFPDGVGDFSKAGSWFYSGDWVLGAGSGVGKFIFPDGSVYQGELKNFLAEGSGTYEDSSGWKYEGEFKQGMRQGQGKFTFANGEIIEGSWENNQPKL